MKKIDSLKTNLERYNRMLMIFKYHIDMVNKMPEYPASIELEGAALSSGRTRTTFCDSTKQYVEELGKKIYEDFRFSKLRVAKVISQKMDIKLRTVYSWVKNIDKAEH